MGRRTNLDACTALMHRNGAGLRRAAGLPYT